MPLFTRTVAAVSLLTFSLGGSALAADAPPNVRQACMPSARSLCATQVAARDRQAVKMCLLTNLDKVEPQCREAIQAMHAAHQGDAAKPPN